MVNEIEIGKIYKIDPNFYNVNNNIAFAECVKCRSAEGYIKVTMNFGSGVPYAIFDVPYIIFNAGLERLDVIFNAGLERLATSEEEFAWRMEQ